MKSSFNLPNIGPKSAAWLRQVGLHTPQDLQDAGAVQAYVRIHRAGFKPSLHLVYALEGALQGCHWQKLDPQRRMQLANDTAAALAETTPRGLPAQASESYVEPAATTLEPTQALFDPID